MCWASSGSKPLYQLQRIQKFCDPKDLISSPGRKTSPQIKEELTALTVCQAPYSELSFSQLLYEESTIITSKEKTF